jgi:hypothetical protein
MMHEGFLALVIGFSCLEGRFGNRKTIWFAGNRQPHMVMKHMTWHVMCWSSSLELLMSNDLPQR